MNALLIDGHNNGNQDRSLNVSAIYFTPSVSTIVRDAGDNDVTDGTVLTGTTVHDTGTLAGAFSAAGGSATYSRFSNLNCTAPAATTEPVTVSNAAVPTSGDFTGSAGFYAYQLAYAGSNGPPVQMPATGPCESFTVVNPPTPTPTVTPTPTQTPVPGALSS